MTPFRPAPALAELAYRLFNAPLALLPAQARLVEHLLLNGGDPSALLGLEGTAEIERRGYDVTLGVAIIEVSGLLLDWDSYCWWGITTYPQLRRSMLAAIADPAVRAVALVVNSPGGLVQRCFDLVDDIYALRGQKPIWAILSENAYSAAYAVASAADRILIPRTGGAGSIGVVTMHTDVTAMLDMVGIRVTTVQFGAQKTETYPTTPITDPALARMQADVDSMGELFVETVARNRGMSAETVRGFEAGTFRGGGAVAAGLADEVLSPDAAFRSLLASLDAVPVRAG